MGAGARNGIDKKIKHYEDQLKAVKDEAQKKILEGKLKSLKEAKQKLGASEKRANSKKKPQDPKGQQANA